MGVTECLMSEERKKERKRYTVQHERLVLELRESLGAKTDVSTMSN